MPSAVPVIFTGHQTRMRFPAWRSQPGEWVDGVRDAMEAALGRRRVSTASVQAASTRRTQRGVAPPVENG
jgi:hypothetical protein